MFGRKKKENTKENTLQHWALGAAKEYADGHSLHCERKLFLINSLEQGLLPPQSFMKIEGKQDLKTAILEALEDEAKMAETELQFLNTEVVKGQTAKDLLIKDLQETEGPIQGLENAEQVLDALEQTIVKEKEIFLRLHSLFKKTDLWFAREKGTFSFKPEGPEKAVLNPSKGEAIKGNLTLLSEMVGDKDTLDPKNGTYTEYALRELIGQHSKMLQGQMDKVEKKTVKKGTKLAKRLKRIQGGAGLLVRGSIIAVLLSILLQFSAGIKKQNEAIRKTEALRDLFRQSAVTSPLNRKELEKTIREIVSKPLPGSNPRSEEEQGTRSSSGSEDQRLPWEGLTQYEGVDATKLDKAYKAGLKSSIEATYEGVLEGVREAFNTGRTEMQRHIETNKNILKEKGFTEQQINAMITQLQEGNLKDTDDVKQLMRDIGFPEEELKEVLSRNLDRYYRFNIIKAFAAKPGFADIDATLQGKEGVEKVKAIFDWLSWGGGKPGLNLEAKEMLTEELDKIILPIAQEAQERAIKATKEYILGLMKQHAKTVFAGLEGIVQGDFEKFMNESKILLAKVNKGAILLLALLLIGWSIYPARLVLNELGIKTFKNLWMVVFGEKPFKIK